ncbi:MAG: amino acid adenylation domain-containing protein [Betaproteobacteria bacterium]|nr:amino acid adenylation domain-containing protein [Betaproteobacteria bacterium]
MDFLLNHLLEQSARRFPDKPAVTFGESVLTYAELDRLSTRLAHVLLEHGLQRGDRVGIWMPKSDAAIVAIHGILKAGGVYVPLDPGAPSDRVRYIVDDCDIRLLVSVPAFLDHVQDINTAERALKVILMAHGPLLAGFAAPMVSYDEVLAHPATDSPRIATLSSDLAYILYTSGSTGTPKGVMISHINALNFVGWACDEFQVTRDDVLSNHAPYHFDLTIFDVFVAMKAGATLAIVPEELAYFPWRLAEWIDRNGITIWYSVPSILTMMVRRGRLERLRYERLRLVLFAGEVFPIRYLRELMQLVPRPKYCNLYGPTETNVITYHYVSGVPDEGAPPLPIGKACANVDVFVVDDEGRVVTQPGVEGELYARGPNVAQGYWGDPQKTGKVFVQNPCQGHSREIVYRTGDIVVLGEDGSYLFRGRRDHMIKSRGYRIEAGEVESAIYRHPQVLETAVVPVPDPDIGNRIRAFVVTRDGELIEAREIQQHCARFLPRYMVPEDVAFLQSLPKTSTGKVDKKALANRQ